MFFFGNIVNEDNDAVDPHMTTGETQTKTSQHLPKSEEEKVSLLQPLV